MDVTKLRILRRNNPGLFEWVLNPMTRVFIKTEMMLWIQRRSCKDGGRDESNGATSQGKL